MSKDSASHPSPGHGVHCLGAGRARTKGVSSCQYGRMFPSLAPLRVAEAALVALGQPGEVCDGAGNNLVSNTAAGWPFFGQLIAHDITADRSLVAHSADEALVNFRAAKLDLECIYAGGPTGSVYLYDFNDGASFLLGTSGEDLPRNAQGIAIIGDARNDSHFLMNRLHLALMTTHNEIVTRLKAADHVPDSLFAQARQKVIWFYQWVVVNEYLPLLIGAQETASLLSGEVGSELADDEKIPVEFADAAFRYGHAQIRSSYQLQTGGPEVAIFPDLLGFKAVPPSRQIDFSLFFDAPGSASAQRSMPISEKMQPPVIMLPTEITGTMPDQTYRSLAARDLRRGLATALPSGEDVARAMGIEPLSQQTIDLAIGADGTPLFYYILREAAVLANGNRLGPVGGRIVGDVLISLIRRDPTSYIAIDPEWHPSHDEILNLSQEVGLINFLDLSKKQSYRSIL
jgi:hypothetical protein